MIRKIVEIDEDRCNGCGVCVDVCAEGAIEIVDGKARLIGDILCDGFGACLGECPEGALRIVEREAGEFDEKAVDERKQANRQPHVSCTDDGNAFVCPGRSVQQLSPVTASMSPERSESESDVGPGLRNWPIQLSLVPSFAPYLMNSDIVVAADCVPFAFPAFSSTFLDGKVLLVGCPKLDNADAHVEKLAEILACNNVNSIEVVHMEVPCCKVLMRIVDDALKLSSVEVDVKKNVISIRGEVVEELESTKV